MPAQPLTAEQLEDAARLKKLFRLWQATRSTAGLEWSQDWAGDQLGFGQSATSQYLNGKIPLNPDAAAKFSTLIGRPVDEFSPAIARDIARLAGGTTIESNLSATLDSWAIDASPRSREVIDQLRLLAQKNALGDDDWEMISQLAMRFQSKAKK